MHTITRCRMSCLAGTFLFFGVLFLGATSIAGADAGQEALEQAIESFTARQKMTTLLPELNASVAIEVQDLLLMKLGYLHLLTSHRKNKKMHKTVHQQKMMTVHVNHPHTF